MKRRGSPSRRASSAAYGRKNARALDDLLNTLSIITQRSEKYQRLGCGPSAPGGAHSSDGPAGADLRAEQAAPGAAIEVNRRSSPGSFHSRPRSQLSRLRVGRAAGRATAREPALDG